MAVDFVVEKGGFVALVSRLLLAPEKKSSGFNSSAGFANGLFFVVVVTL